MIGPAWLRRPRDLRLAHAPLNEYESRVNSRLRCPIVNDAFRAIEAQEGA
jgi:hypothetical protein